MPSSQRNGSCVGMPVPGFGDKARIRDSGHLPALVHKLPDAIGATQRAQILHRAVLPEKSVHLCYSEIQQKTRRA